MSLGFKSFPVFKGLGVGNGTTLSQALDDGGGTMQNPDVPWPTVDRTTDKTRMSICPSIVYKRINVALED